HVFRGIANLLIRLRILVPHEEPRRQEFFTSTVQFEDQRFACWIVEQGWRSIVSRNTRRFWSPSRPTPTARTVNCFLLFRLQLRDAKSKTCGVETFLPQHLSRV